MTIETKYNIGDKVFVDLYKKDAMRGEIVGYRCFIGEYGNKEEFYQVLLDFHLYVDIKIYSADKVFSTKEELLKSL